MNKIAIITDLHFGVKKNNQDFLTSQLDFFNKRFFPYLEKNNIDTIMILGDVFDNRQYLNINVLNKIDELMIEQFNKYNTYILIGNHDITYKTTIDVHSLKTFRHLSNIHIVEDIEKIKINNRDILLVPWQVDNNEFVKKVSNKNLNKLDICFGHFEINGFFLNNTKVCDFGLDSKLFFNNYTLTFSGHFHKRKLLEQGNNKIQYVGSPYELTRTDRDTEKGFCVLDTDTLEYEFIENNISIKHKLFKYPEKFIEEDIKGNIIDVVVDVGENYKEKEFQKYMLEIDTYKPIFQPELKLENNVNMVAKEDYKIQSTEELIEEYIDDIDLDDKVKNDVREKMIELYKECKQEG